MLEDVSRVVRTVTGMECVVRRLLIKFLYLGISQWDGCKRSSAEPLLWLD